MLERESGALLDALRGVHWPARRVTRGALTGSHRSRRIGASPEFMEYRPYQQGDDPSKIDWKLFARTERVAVRLSHDDSSLRTMVLLDASASMAFPENTLAKWELARAVTLGLASVAHGDNDPVGVTVSGSLPRRLPPRSRRGTVAEVMNLLREVSPAGSAPLAPLLATMRSNRRLAIVSDFLGDAESILRTAGELLAAGTELFAIHVVDPEELDPAPAVRIVVDPEQDRIRRPLGPAELTGYRERFAAWRMELAGRWHELGAVYTEVRSDEEPGRCVRRIVGSSGAR